MKESLKKNSLRRDVRDLRTSSTSKVACFLICSCLTSFLVGGLSSKVHFLFSVIVGHQSFYSLQIEFMLPLGALLLIAGSDILYMGAFVCNLLMLNLWKFVFSPFCIVGIQSGNGVYFPSSVLHLVLFAFPQSLKKFNSPSAWLLIT